jgi:hypothetical protein
MAVGLTFGPAGSEAARIDASGRLLIGTSSSRGGWWNTTGIDSAVQVEATNQWCFSAVNNSANTNGPWINIGKSRGATVGSTTVVQSSDQLGGISFQGADGSELVTAAAIQAFVDGTPGSNDMPGRIVLATTANGASSPTERMRISQDGSTYINATSGFNGQLTVAKNGERCLTLHNTATGATSQEIQNFYRNNVQVGSIATTNSATAYYTSSDYRIKENVTAVDDGIARLQQLKPSRFNFIADPDRTVDGFIAHEVQGCRA